MASFNTNYFISTNSGLVLAIQNGHANQGAFVVLANKHEQDVTQHWVFEADGTISSVANRSLVLDIKNPGVSAGEEIVVWTKHGGWNQRWVYDGGLIRIADERTLVLDGKEGNVGSVVFAIYESTGYSNARQWQLSPAPHVSVETHTVRTTTTHVSHTDTKAVWNNVDSVLDQIIALAVSLKGQTAEVKTKFDGFLTEQETALRKLDSDRESVEESLKHASSRAEQERLQHILSQKEEEEKKKVAEYDAQIHKALQEKAKFEEELASSKGNALEERNKITRLLGDLEEDALSYSRLRPSKPLLTESDVDIIRVLFLTAAVSGTGKVSFQDLQQIIAKYQVSEPNGNLKKLFQIVQQDSKGRMSYITVVAVANDLAALVGDFKKIDANGNGTLSRKEFRDHFTKLGFTHRSTLDTIFRFGDEDESDDITFHEFVHLSVTLLVLRILFSAADYDKNGKLSKDEISRVLSEAAIPVSSLSKFDHFYSVVDADNSNYLDFNEFVMLVLNMFVDD